MNDVVERVARAIEVHFSAADRAYGEHFDCARAAIEAMREPSPEMIAACGPAPASLPLWHAMVVEIWGIMLSAALADASPDIGKEGKQ